MSLPPITIDELDPAGPINSNADYLVVRQGLTDRRATPAQIAVLDLSNLVLLQTPLTETDVLLVGRPDGLGGYTNYRISPQRIGFLQGTTMWFYQTSVPLLWRLVTNVGDRVLATGIQGDPPPIPDTKYRGRQVQQGTWQQEGATLLTTQIPNHRHYAMVGDSSVGSPPVPNPNYRGSNSIAYPVPVQGGGRGVVGAFNDNPTHDNYGECAPHNHGNIWRPAALVGMLCIKEVSA